MKTRFVIWSLVEKVILCLTCACVLVCVTMLICVSKGKREGEESEMIDAGFRGSCRSWHLWLLFRPGLQRPGGPFAGQNKTSGANGICILAVKKEKRWGWGTTNGSNMPFNTKQHNLWELDHARFITAGRTGTCLHSRNGNSSWTQHSKNILWRNADTFIICYASFVFNALSG